MLTSLQIYKNSISSFLAEAGCEATECVLKYYLYDDHRSLLSQNFYFFSSLSVRACGSNVDVADRCRM
jgi:hypothetical protein